MRYAWLRTRKEHWQTVYETKAPTDVSWYQPVPQRSLALIQSTGLPPSAALLDVGGGASTLADHLLAAGFSDITVLDVAPAALEAAQARLGAAGAPVQMIAADVTVWQPPRRYDLWHDRAVFHFLVDVALRAQYLDVLRAALAPGGYLVMATFGPEGAHALQWPGRAALLRRRAERGAWAGVPPRHERDRGALRRRAGTSSSSCTACGRLNNQRIILGLNIRPLSPADRDWVARHVAEHWGAEIVVTHGTLYHPAALPASSPRWMGRWSDWSPSTSPADACEIVTLDSLRAGQGIGTALIEAVKAAASAAGCRRLWLITTNDNLHALGFYQKRGFRLVAVHPGAVDDAAQAQAGDPADRQRWHPDPR